MPFNPIPLTPEAILLTGKVAFVTGGASGLGGACGSGFARFGAKVAIADKDRERGEALARQIIEDGGDALFVAVDVLHVDQIEDAIARAAAHFGRIDILVNNAGGLNGRPFMEQSERSWRKHIDFNLVSVLAGCRAAGRLMIEQGEGGVIINMASTEGLRAAPNCSVYAACKAGIISLTRTLSLELSGDRIRVHALAPDWLATDGIMLQASQSEAAQRARQLYIPLQDIGHAEDAAAAAIFLASPMGRYLTGLTIPIDGGTIASSGWTRNEEGRWSLYHPCK